MRHRTARRAASVVDTELVLQDPAIRRAADEYTAYLRGERAVEPQLGWLNDESLATVQRFSRRQADDPFDEKWFLRKMNELRPALVQPRVTDHAGDLLSALTQPEVLYGFWPSLDPRGGTRGSHPGIGAKALLFVAATLGHSAHFDNNHRLLMSDARLVKTFETVESLSASATGATPRLFLPRSYEQVLRQLHSLCERFSVADAIATNVELVRSAHRLLGIRKVRVGIDGSLFPAWVPQVGKRSPAREADLRRVAHRAAARFHSARPSADAGASSSGARPGLGRLVRGYYLVALTDLGTGLPLTWVLWPADWDEAKALKALMFNLFELWPDLDLEVVVADAAWDEQWAAEWTLRNYGAPLVAHRHPSLREKEYRLDRFSSASIAAFFGDGRAICRDHDVLMIRDGFEGRRTGLAPGEAAPASAFTLRFRCPVDSARPRLRMQEHWSALAYHPHSHAAGNPKLHAERVALQHYRNRCEALFSSLQTGHALGLDGAGRTHTAKEPTVEALCSVAMMMMSAVAVARLREADA